MSHYYVHVPFCRRRCVYCDFAISVRTAVPGAAFVDAVAEEMKIRGPLAATDHESASVYLGGGTPSLLPDADLANLLERLPVDAAKTEVTLEANPDDVTAERAAAWKKAGVTRVSLGVQSFDDGILGWMHRTHSAAEAVAAYEALRGVFDNVSLDLIFALPVRLKHDFTSDLDQAISLDPDHVSVYGLTVEPMTPLGKWVGAGRTAAAPSSHYSREFLLAHERLTSSGYDHYEISNYARAGYRSRHNACYWSGSSYQGLGPSGHSFDATSHTRRWNVANWAEYESRLSRGSDPIGGNEQLLPSQQLLENLFLGLRTAEGVDCAPLEDSAFLAGLIDEGMARLSDGRLALTPRGWLKTDEIVVGLTTYAEGG